MKKFTVFVLALLSLSACQQNKKTDEIQSPQNIHDFMATLVFQPENAGVWVNERNELLTRGDSIFTAYSVEHQYKCGCILDTVVGFWEPLEVEYQVRNYATGASNPKDAIDNMNGDHLQKVVREDDICIYLSEPNLKRVYDNPNGLYITYSDEETVAQLVDFLSFGKGTIILEYSGYFISLDNMHLEIAHKDETILSKNVQAYGNNEL